MARPYGERSLCIRALVQKKPLTFAEIERALAPIKRATLAKMLTQMTLAGYLRRVKRLRAAAGRKWRWLYSAGPVPMLRALVRRARSVRPMSALPAERGAPKVSMHAYGALCAAFRIGLPALAPAADLVRTVLGIEHMRPNRDIAQHALPVWRFTHPVSEFPVVAG